MFQASRERCAALASKLKSSNRNDSPLRPLTQQWCPGNEAAPFLSCPLGSSRFLGRCVVRIDPEAARSLSTAETPAAPQLNKGRPLHVLIVAYTTAAPRSLGALELIENYVPILALPWRLDKTRFAFETKCKSF